LDGVAGSQHDVAEHGGWVSLVKRVGRCLGWACA
jgi:hypothetical protein